PHAQARGDVVDESLRHGPESGDQVLARVGDAVAVGVAEGGQQRRVHDVKRSADEGDALRRVELVGEDGDLVRLAVAVGVDAELHARQALVALGLRVVLVLADEELSVRRYGDARGALDVEGFDERVDGEAFGDLGHRRRRVGFGGVGEARGAQKTDQTNRAHAHSVADTRRLGKSCRLGRTMPRVIDYPIVLEQLTAAGFVSLYHNAGAFGFAADAHVHAIGWVGVDDPTIRDAAR